MEKLMLSFSIDVQYKMRMNINHHCRNSHHLVYIHRILYHQCNTLHYSIQSYLHSRHYYYTSSSTSESENIFRNHNIETDIQSYNHSNRYVVFTQTDMYLDENMQTNCNRKQSLRNQYSAYRTCLVSNCRLQLTTS